MCVSIGFGARVAVHRCCPPPGSHPLSSPLDSHHGSSRCGPQLDIRQFYSDQWFPSACQHDGRPLLNVLSSVLWLWEMFLEIAGPVSPSPFLQVVVCCPLVGHHVVILCSAFQGPRCVCMCVCVCVCVFVCDLDSWVGTMMPSLWVIPYLSHSLKRNELMSGEEILARGFRGLLT